MLKYLINMEAFVRFPDFGFPSLDGKVMFRVHFKTSMKCDDGQLYIGNAL